MTLKKALKILLIVLLLWIGIFTADLITVVGFDHSPIFCIESKDKSHFTGLGYSYDAYKHPISGDFEYCLYIFSLKIKSTFTNEISPMNSNINSDLYQQRCKRCTNYNFVESERVHER